MAHRHGSVNDWVADAGKRILAQMQSDEDGHWAHMVAEFARDQEAEYAYHTAHHTAHHDPEGRHDEQEKPQNHDPRCKV